MRCWSTLRDSALVVLGAWLGVGATGAAAQQSAPPAEATRRSNGDNANEVIVIAPDVKDRKRVRQLATRITMEGAADLPMARFQTPLCIRTVGMADPMAGLFAKRVARNATAAGAEVADDGCRANMIVIFVDDGASDLRAAREKQPGLFGNLTSAEIERSIDEPGPVHSWTQIEVRPSDGTGYVTVASILALPIRRDIVSTMVVIDRAAAIGKTIGQLADYATMRGLASIRASGVASEQDTILTLFRTGQAATPPALTGFDRTYLKTLYSGRANEKPSTKIRQIARRMARDTVDR